MSAPAAARPRRQRWAIVATAVAALTVAAVGILLAVPRSHAGAPGPLLRPCDTRSPVPCYGQDPLHRVYGLGALYQRGITGKGTTIAVIAPYLNPWAVSDLAVYSHRLRLPIPQLKAINIGHAPDAVLGDAAAAAWAQEAAADLEAAHFIAPRARLVYVGFSPGANDEAAAMAALSWLVTHVRVDVVSFSWGRYEPDFAGPGGRRQLGTLRRGLVAAARAGVTVVAGSDDSGPTIPAPRGGLEHVRAVAWPTSDPLVTAVGSAVLHTRPDGTRLRPDTVAGNDGRGHATGAGLSVLYPRPPWQDRVAAVTGNHRGVVDVSMALSAWCYAHLAPPWRGHPGWVPISGSSISAPLFAGIVALAAQVAGHPLGVLGPALYGMHGSRDGVLDITQGSNSLGGVPGFTARPGYDLPSGIGTVASAWPFVKALAQAGRQATLISANTSEEQ